MSAEVRPSLRAVKKPEKNMAKPAKINENEKTLKPLWVISSSAGSYPTNILERGRDREKPSVAQVP